MAGGTEQQLVELVTRLDRSRFEPSVLCLYGERSGRSLHFLSHLQRCGIPVTILDLERTVVGKVRGLLAICRHLRQNKPDIVQAVNYHSNLLVRLASPFLPWSIRIIGCVYVEYTAKQLIYERLSSWICDAVVCNSMQIERQLREVSGNQFVARIPNGIDIDRFAGASDQSFRMHISPSARRAILFLGRISYQKSPHLLLEALAILKGEALLPDGTAAWIVGEVDDPGEQLLLDGMVGEQELHDVVVQLPAVDCPEMLYAAADLLVLPSLWEGLPNVMLEALATGRPVIISEAANRDGLVRHGVNGWVFPTGDAVRLAEILYRALALSDADLDAMQHACRETANSFDVGKMVNAYECLYERFSARS